MQPFDMVKTRFQLNESKNSSVATALRGLLKEGILITAHIGMLIYCERWCPSLVQRHPSRISRNDSEIELDVCYSGAVQARTHPDEWREVHHTCVLWIRIPQRISRNSRRHPVSGTKQRNHFSFGLRKINQINQKVVKVRLQAKEHLGRYHNSFDCLFKVSTEIIPYPPPPQSPTYSMY